MPNKSLKTIMFVFGLIIVLSFVASVFTVPPVERFAQKIDCSKPYVQKEAKRYYENDGPWKNDFVITPFAANASQKFGGEGTCDVKYKLKPKNGNVDDKNDYVRWFQYNQVGEEWKAKDMDKSEMGREKISK